VRRRLWGAGHQAGHARLAGGALWPHLARGPGAAARRATSGMSETYPYAGN
jgi:hypothetical protein